MTIKIKAPVIWLEEADLRGFMTKRLTERERKYRIVSDSDWRKLMALVQAADDYRGGDDGWGCAELYAIVVARDALEKKK